MRLARRKPIILAVVIVATLLGAPALARLWVYAAAHSRVYADVHKIPKCRVAIVLGTQVYPNGDLSHQLADRVRTGVRLYKAGVVNKLLMSGDNRRFSYNEPLRMRDYAVKLGVPRADVAMDFAGRRTYDSIYRAKHIFGLKRFIIVSQSYHLYRAIFLCDAIGVEGYGMATKSAGHPMSRIREFPACIGALVDTTLRQPHPVMGKRERI